MRQDFRIRVLVCDNSRVHTQLLADILKRDDRLQVTTSESGAEGLITRPNFGDVDVLVIGSTLDEQPGRGFEVLRNLRIVSPEIRAVIMLDSSKGSMVLDAFRAGARGVFGTHESVNTLSKCVCRVFEGQIWANSQQMATLSQALASSHTILAIDARGLNLLSKRELEVVQSVAQGLSNREIADRLHISQHTVKNSLFRIFDKLGVSNRVELLFMTLSQERSAPSALQYFLDDHSYMSLRDESTLIGCEKGAEQGVLMTQVALAQFYSTRRANISDVLRAYMWYSMASEQIARAFRQLTKALTMDQLLQAEQMVADRLSKKGVIPDQTAASADRSHLDADEAFRQPQLRKRTKSDREPLAAPA
jgi:DNA-binding NarL/FixJ family response regulator